MKRSPVFFHIRDKGLLPHTYCVNKNGNDLVVGYSIVEGTDSFCKKTGREISQKKTKILNTIPEKNFKKISATENLPQSVSATIGAVIQRSGELFGLVGTTKVKTFANLKASRTPVVKEFEIVPKTPTQISNDIFGGF